MKNIFKIIFILLLFCSSTALAAGATGAKSMSLLTILFLAFGAVIIVFQAIPGLILFFSMIKGLFSTAPGKLGPASRDKSERKG